ncbi:hypothetical protein [Nocardioides sp. SR21]|uniref:hypothetical protein n=1 Tax=Nocardioides sp. SR21 TaxID=2919501 RepID=UPI001FAA643F|nr:hypothetical protein [Nocardioides sp. SR21]
MPEARRTTELDYTAIDRVREFLRIVPIGRPHVGDGTIVSVSGLGHLTIADLRALIDLAERPAIDAAHIEHVHQCASDAYPNHEPSAYCICVCGDRFDGRGMASPPPADDPAEAWECGPHTNAWNGHDARCRRITTPPGQPSPVPADSGPVALPTTAATRPVPEAATRAATQIGEIR